jgi:hypothetical protein
MRTYTRETVSQSVIANLSPDSQHPFEGADKGEAGTVVRYSVGSKMSDNKKGLAISRKPLWFLVAGSGFEPETFGL